MISTRERVSLSFLSFTWVITNKYVFLYTAIQLSMFFICHKRCLYHTVVSGKKTHKKINSYRTFHLLSSAMISLLVLCPFFFPASHFCACARQRMAVFAHTPPNQFGSPIFGLATYLAQTAFDRLAVDTLSQCTFAHALAVTLL